MNYYLPFRPIKGQAVTINTGLSNDSMLYDISGACINSDGSKVIISVKDNSYGGLYLTSDNGLTFTKLSNVTSSTSGWYYEALACNSDMSQIIVVLQSSVSASKKVYISTDMGVTWIDRTPLENLVWNSVASDNDGSNLIAGSVTKLYISSDNGISWIERQPVARSWDSVASDNDGSNLIASINSSEVNGRIWISSDSGVNWVESRPAGDVNRAWTSVASNSDGSILYATVGSTTNGRIYKSIDSGSSWTELQPAGDINAYWSSISCTSNGNIIVVSGLLGIYYSNNGGTTWTLKSNISNILLSKISNNGNAIFFTSSSVAYGYAYLSFDSGTTFKTYFNSVTKLTKDGINNSKTYITNIINNELNSIIYSFIADDINADNVSLEFYNPNLLEYHRKERIIIYTQKEELTTAPTKLSSLEDKVTALFQYFFGKRTVTASAETLYKDNGTDVLATNTLSDNGTTVTKGKLS